MEGDKNLCANLINGELKTLIEDTIFKKFGVTTDIHATVYPRYVDIADNNNDVDKKMRGNKMLRSIFSSVSLGGTAWLEQETGNVRMNLRVWYSHPNGGSNGRELGYLTVYTAKGKAKISQY